MFYAEKRIKLSNESIINNNKKKNCSSASNSTDHGIESDFNSQVDFTNSVEEDFSLPPVKRKTMVSRQVSFMQHKQSFDLTDTQQSSLGYSSLLSSSISSPRKSLSRTPKKRKFDDTETDENAFYNSYQFVSPLKITSKDSSISCKRAKLILKEKSSSENVMLSSTPIRNSNKNKLWGKFRSLHPEKFETGRSFDDINRPPFLPKSTEESFDCGSSFDLTNSFDLTSNAEYQENIPNNLQQLWTGSIIPGKVAIPNASEPTETVTKSQEKNSSSTSSNLSTSRRIFLNGRSKLDICGKLYMEHNIALKKILTHLNDNDLLSLSHVSKEYRNMITSNKTWETKRHDYLKAYQKIKENKIPGSFSTSLSKPTLHKDRKKAFGDSNINHTMELRPKPTSPPGSPTRKRFLENQKVSRSYSGPMKKCPRCCKTATLSSIKIRSSPRKRKKSNSILKICSISSGRVQKQAKSFLSQSSIDSHSLTDEVLTTFPILEESRSSTSASSSCASPIASLSSDDSCYSESETAVETVYEFFVCSGHSCNFKFCVKCNCKYHPRQMCKELLAASPSRSNKSSVACSNRSFKSLKRLFKV